MLEEIKTFWLRAGDSLPAIRELDLPSFDIVYNIVCSPFILTDVQKNIEEIRKIRCGFEFHMPTTNLFLSISDFSNEVAAEIDMMDTFLPQITTNLVVSDADIQQDTVLSFVHKKYDIAVKHKIYIAFYFVLIKDYRILGLTLRKIAQLNTLLESHIDNIMSTARIVLELSPMIFANENKSFYENTHFEIDNIISELSLYSDFNMKTNNTTTCGLINILRQEALTRGIMKKFFTLSTKEIVFSFSEHSCFYNLFCGQSLSCSECHDKLLKNLTLNLGVFDSSVKDLLDDTGEKSEFKVLAADWDYIV
jgi:hypothetical protein